MKLTTYIPHLSVFSSLPSRHSGCPSQTHEVGMQAGIPLVQLKLVLHDILPEIKRLIHYCNLAVPQRIFQPVGTSSDVECGSIDVVSLSNSSPLYWPVH